MPDFRDVLPPPPWEGPPIPKLAWRPWREPIREVITFPYLIVSTVDGEVVDWMTAGTERGAEDKSAKLHESLKRKGYPFYPKWTRLETRIYHIEKLRGW